MLVFHCLDVIRSNDCNNSNNSNNENNNDENKHFSKYENMKPQKIKIMMSNTNELDLPDFLDRTTRYKIGRSHDDKLQTPGMLPANFIELDT